jgi:hypothetical protein
MYVPQVKTAQKLKYKRKKIFSHAQKMYLMETAGLTLFIDEEPEPSTETLCSLPKRDETMVIVKLCQFTYTLHVYRFLFFLLFV